MRYIDTGSRDPHQALGAWLEKILDGSVVALRWQSGFFSAKVLALFARTFTDLQKANLPLRLLVGSNDGTTPRADVEELLQQTGPARSNRQIGVVSFDAGYFHPKTVHITRNDGSTAAYVGSANLTDSGLASLHIEAGLLLDTRDRDDSALLAAIASAIDWWFAAHRNGLNIVSGSADLDPLVVDGVLDVPSPAPSRPAPKTATAGKRRGFSLKRLVTLPALAAGSKAVPTGPAPATPAGSPATAAKPATWGKRLTRSDAQRKPTGNQRGSVTLVRSIYAIDAQRYFRHDFFKMAAWKPEVTHTGEKREAALVPFDITLLGKKLGVRQIVITHAPNRESQQANYTSLLHLQPTLAPPFAKMDLTYKWLELRRLADGGYSLEVRDVP